MKTCCRNCAYAKLRKLDTIGLYEMSCKVLGNITAVVSDAAIDEIRDEGCFDPKE